MKTIESIENLIGDVTLYTALVSLSVALIVILLAIFGLLSNEVATPVLGYIFIGGLVGGILMTGSVVIVDVAKDILA